MTKLTLPLAFSAFMLCLFAIGFAPLLASTQSPPTATGTDSGRQMADPFDHSSLAGNYLASRFAQKRHDWDGAAFFMKRVLDMAPDDITITKRAMVLAMGAGDYDQAATLAQSVHEADKENALALLFMTIDAFRKKEYARTAEILSTVPENGLSEFITPLLRSWSKAALGEYDTRDLSGNIIYIYHAILIADFLKEHSHIERLLERALNAQNMSADDLERIADIYAHINQKETALQLYRSILSVESDVPSVREKIRTLEEGQDVRLFQTVTSPEEGMGEALYDMARLLYNEYSDESARIFTNMALALNPGLIRARLLLAHIATRNEHYAEAIAQYRSVPPGHEFFLDSRREAAKLMEDEGDIEGALLELEMLAKNHGDIESLIQIGDIYRHNGDFKSAIAAYNRAEEKILKNDPARFWHVYYARGMSYEQLGQWPHAEADLKTALSYQPDHPFILNYLGYAWADRGSNLKDSLVMIEKAASLRPADGYIIDSLGWVLYRMERYNEAVPHLEKAVELRPYDPVINDHLGDAYWRVGRKMEARFQWLRAKNHIDEDKDDALLLETIEKKLSEGLSTSQATKEARSQAVNATEILHP